MTSAGCNSANSPVMFHSARLGFEISRFDKGKQGLSIPQDVMLAKQETLAHSMKKDRTSDLTGT